MEACFQGGLASFFVLGLNSHLPIVQSLTVLDYCLHNGSENVVIYFQDNIYVIKTLKEFQYSDEEGKDQGANVRQKAKDITNLLTDEGRLREERRSRAHMRDRMLRGVDSGDNDDENENAHRRERSNGQSSKKPVRDEDELKKAIEESKRSLAKEQKDREDMELEEALRLSKEEEEKRKIDVASSNADALFDDAYQLCVFIYFRPPYKLLRYTFTVPLPPLHRQAVLSLWLIPPPTRRACNRSIPSSLK